jgi:hypothetical protein
MLFGEATTEFWGNTGAADFPFAPVRGSTLEYGLAARWSLAKYDSSLAGLFKNRMGQVQVMRLQGYTPVPMSNPELDSIINGYATVGCDGFTRMQGGHPFYQINFPTPGEVVGVRLADSACGARCSRGCWGRGIAARFCLDFINKPASSTTRTGTSTRSTRRYTRTTGTRFRSVLVAALSSPTTTA